jgi:ABC-2 type transport system permease protein
LFQSRLLTAFFVLCFFFPIGAMASLYVNHSASLLSTLHLQAALFEVGGNFFFLFLAFQGTLAFILTTFVGPGLVSPDLANGALALYFCRPFTRAEYVLGKMAVIFLLLSMITWMPGLVLFVIQASLAGAGWMWSNLWIAGALVAGSLIWILILSLLALAISAWVKWKVAAAGLMLGIFFMGSGFGEAVNAILRTKQGTLLNIGNLMRIVWVRLFRIEATTAVDFSPAEAWIALIVICACCLGLLSRKLRAHEVVK